MRQTKTLGIAVVLALALTAFVGASSAQAGIQVKSCKGAANCQPATESVYTCEENECWPETYGTTFTIEGPFKFKNAFAWTECDATLTATVTDNESVGAGDSVELLATEGWFTNCFGWWPIGQNFPWAFTIDAPKFIAGNPMQTQNVQFMREYGSCVYGNTEKAKMTLAWYNESTQSKVAPGGMVENLPGQWGGCTDKWQPSGPLKIVEVNDPENTEADNLRILTF